MCHVRLHKKIFRVLFGFRLGLGVRDSVGGLVFVVTPPHTVTVTQDLDSRQQHLDTHLDGSPELLVRNEFVDVRPLPTTRFQSQYCCDKTKC